ncbi:hypothetical protein Tco_0537221 [Tanacetum coccineum]
MNLISMIESRDAIFDENRFSSIPRPNDIIPNSDESQRDDHSDMMLDNELYFNVDGIRDQVSEITSQKSLVGDTNDVQKEDGKSMEQCNKFKLDCNPRHCAWLCELMTRGCIVRLQSECEGCVAMSEEAMKEVGTQIRKSWCNIDASRGSGYIANALRVRVRLEGMTGLFLFLQAANLQASQSIEEISSYILCRHLCTASLESSDAVCTNPPLLLEEPNASQNQAIVACSVNCADLHNMDLDIDLWHIIVYGDYKPTIKNKDTNKEEIIPYEKFEETHMKMVSKNDEATSCFYYNAFA